MSKYELHTSFHATTLGESQGIDLNTRLHEAFAAVSVSYPGMTAYYVETPKGSDMIHIGLRFDGIQGS